MLVAGAGRALPRRRAVRGRCGPDELRRSGLGAAARATGRWARPDRVLQAAPAAAALIAERSRARSSTSTPAVDVHAPLDPVARALERHGGAGRAAAARRRCRTTACGPTPADLRARRPARRLAGRGRAAPRGRRAVSTGGRSGCTSASRRSPPGRRDRRCARRELTAGSTSRRASSPASRCSTIPASAVELLEPARAHARAATATRFTVDGRPLRFAHFEGFDPARPFLLQPGADRVAHERRARRSPRCASPTRERLRRRPAGATRAGAPTSAARCRTGMTFDDRLSHLLAEAAAAGEALGDVVRSPSGARQFMRLARAARRRTARLSGVNRFLYARLPRARGPAGASIRTSTAPTAHGFAGWAWVFGRVEMGIPERFLPPRPPGVGTGRPSRQAQRPPAPRCRAGRRPDLSVNVTGLLHAARSGSARPRAATCRRSRRRGIPVSTSTVDVSEFVKPAARPARGLCASRLHRPRRRRVGRLQPDLHQRRRAAARSPSPWARTFFTERPAIGVWALGDRPGARALARARSTCSTRSGSTRATSPRTSGGRRRSRCGACRRPCRRPTRATCSSTSACPDGFRFLFMFDFFSTIQRKNPVGLIEAFRQAFEPGEGPQLVIKTINGVHRPRGARGAAVGGARPAGRARHRPFAQRARARRARRGLRLLRVAAPQRGLRPHARGVHGARQAGDRAPPSPARPTS